VNGHHDDEPVLFVPDDPRTPVPVAAGEPVEAGWLAGGPAGRLATLDADAHASYRRRFAGDPFPPATLPALIETRNRDRRRIGLLLDQAGARR
jgi:hypothetical protein